MSWKNMAKWNKKLVTWKRYTLIKNVNILLKILYYCLNCKKTESKKILGCEDKKSKKLWFYQTVRFSIVKNQYLSNRKKLLNYYVPGETYKSNSFSWSSFVLGVLRS